MKKYCVCFASNNKGKLDEVRRITENYFRVLSLKDLGIDCDPDETGATLEQNALIKTQTVRKYTNLPIIADDSGLFVDSLHGAPGVYSHRYAGEDGDYNKNIAKLLNEMQGSTDRSAHFKTSICFLTLLNDVYITHGLCGGTIAKKQSSDGYGFGYDPVFIPHPEYVHDVYRGKTLACIPPNEKNIFSSRAEALRCLIITLENVGYIKDEI